MKYILVVLLLALSGCVSFSKIEVERNGEKCRAVAEGRYFSFNTPGVLDKCDSERT